MAVSFVLCLVACSGADEDGQHATPVATPVRPLQPALAEGTQPLDGPPPLLITESGRRFVLRGPAVTRPQRTREEHGAPLRGEARPPKHHPLDIPEADLAEKLRAVALFEGGEYVEETAPLELARQVQHRWRTGEIPPPTPSGEAQDGDPPKEGGGPGIAPTWIFGSNQMAMNASDVTGQPYSSAVLILEGDWRLSNPVSTGAGTAQMVGVRTAVTAAHTQWWRPDNAWWAVETFVPGARRRPDGTWSAPYGRRYGCYVPYFPSAYQTEPDDYDALYWDYAGIEFISSGAGCGALANPGAATGWHGTLVQSDANTTGTPGYNMGYPWDTTDGEFAPYNWVWPNIWTSWGYTGLNPSWPGLTYYTFDMARGQSGSGHWKWMSGSRYVTSIVVAEFSDGTFRNWNRRYDSGVDAFIVYYTSL